MSPENKRELRTITLEKAIMTNMEIISQYSPVPELSFLPAPIGAEPGPPGKTLKFCQFNAFLSSKNFFKSGIRKIN